MLQQFTIANSSLPRSPPSLCVRRVFGASGRRGSSGNRPPQSYTVQKGDTLWGISGKFLKDPWRWPDVWRMNREQIRNPHLIYPGDVIVLDRVDGQWRLIRSSARRPGCRRPCARRRSTRRRSRRFPPDDIEPYLTRPLVTGPGASTTPRRSSPGATRARRARRGRHRLRRRHRPAGRRLLVHLPAAGARSCPSTARRCSATSSGSSAPRGSSASPTRRRCASPTTHPGKRIDGAHRNANEEILIGDRMLPAPRGVLVNYVPHAPTRPIQAEIIATRSRRDRSGPRLDRDARQGRSRRRRSRHVLAVYRVIPPMPDPRIVERPI